jgi:uncharacterized protein YkwD
MTSRTISSRMSWSMASGLVFGLMLVVPSLAMAQLTYDSAGEQHILDLANQARAQAGLPALKLDPGLTAAARQHSARMAAQQKLTHDFPGEPALPVRLGARVAVPLTAEGENVGYAATVEGSQQAFMRSPHHRANLLDADFNVVGFGVVRSGRLVYVTQDFARVAKPLSKK